MGKIGMILKVATVAGPAVVNVIRKYGPQLKEIARDNPELVGKIKNRLTLTSNPRIRANSLTSVASRIAVLRDQVTYLYASANTPAVARQASAWRAELDVLDSAIPVVGAMSKAAQRNEVKVIQKRIDKLSSAILAAVITDDIEDAEMVTEVRDGGLPEVGDVNGKTEY